METPAEIIRIAIAQCAEGGPFDWVDVEDHVINSLRANGYVIKRAVPPCRAYDFEEHNDAA